MLAWLRRRKASRRHPSPDAAYIALQSGLCMYASVNACSGPPMKEGLRSVADPNDILVCKAHYGRLRKIPPRDLDRLERHLIHRFAEARPALHLAGAPDGMGY